MAGANIWNSLTSDFQLELLGQEAEFAKENEYDGLQLWHHIRTEVNPSTKVGACALKEKIESKTLQHFGMDVKAYNAWLVDTRKEIIRQEGTGKYNEYIRYMFKTYFSSKNSEFNETIKDVKRKWTQDLLNKDYSLTDLMSTASKTYNNIVADGGWSLSDSTTKGGSDSMEAKFLALTAQVEALKYSKDSGTYSGTRNNEQTSWRYKNPDNKHEMTRNDRKYKFYKNDCHKQPMWCARLNCLSREAFANKKKGENEGTSSKVGGLSNDFKIALAAVTSDEDYKALEAQFLSKKYKVWKMEIYH